VIVTCERCATQFQLDDTRVPADGVRVRCSRCKHAFEVVRPEMSEAVRIKRVARRALEESTPPDEPASVEASRPGIDDPVEEEESDWGFNDDRSLPGEADEALAGGEDARRTARSVVDELLGSVPPLAVGSDPADPTRESAYGFGGADDQGAGASADGSPGPDAFRPSTLQEQLEATPVSYGPGDLGGGGDHGLEADLDDEPDAGDTPDELGDPDEWDFFANDPDEVVRGEQPGPPPESLGRAAVRVAIAGELVEEDELSRLALWRGRLGGAVGWTATALLFLFGLHAGLAPRALESGAPVRTALAGVELEGVRGRWIDNLVAGPIYVVSGVVRGSAVPATPLVLELIDARGEPVGAAPIPLGPPVATVRLREEAPSRLRDPDGATRHGPRGPFTAVVGTPPAGATAYRFAAVKSDPSSPEAVVDAIAPRPDDAAEASGPVPGTAIPLGVEPLPAAPAPPADLP
jgi:predicted Zn finger-like uncharacterized protein